MSLDLELELTSNPSRKLILLPSGRAIKSAFVTLKPDSKGFLPRISTINEFFDNLFLFDGKVQIDHINKQILLHQAYVECDKNAKLGFDKEFLRFLSSSEFLDSFFSELNGELVELDDIDTCDTYAEYAEHLEILKKISSEYITLLAENSFYDRKYAKPIGFNQLYLDLIDCIDVYVDGYPTNRELFALFEVAKTKQVRLNIHKNRFSDKLCKKLIPFGVDMLDKPFGNYLVNLQNGTIDIYQEAKKPAKVLSSSFGQRIYQVGFLFYMIERFIDDGFSPDDICVVVPDESFAQILKPYDTMRNLNFAMGEPILKSRFFSKLTTLRDYVCKGDEEARQKLEYYGCLEILEDELDTNGAVNALLMDEYESLAEVVKNELLNLNLAVQNNDLSEQSKLWLFTDILTKQKVDDVNGGKVTVIGPLETRSSSFKALIIVDFNEQKVPKSDDKDLFLNAKIRLGCGLPTSKERDDLQCYYYDRMIESAEIVAISYVKNEKESPSHLLSLIKHDESGFSEAEAIGVLQKLLFVNSPIKPDAQNDENVYKIQKLSASSLKDFLECKKRYYLKYIKKIAEHVDEKELKASQMGSLFHSTAMKVINQNSKKISVEELKKRFTQEIEAEISRKITDEFAFEAYLMLSRLEPFFEFESKRLEYTIPKLVEQDFVFTRHGIGLNGKIDRVDIDNDGKISILDYKLKNSVVVDSQKSVETKPDEIVDFQLEIYLLAVMELFGVSTDEIGSKISLVGYYDIYNASIVTQDNLSEKLKILDKTLSVLGDKSFSSDDFIMCEKKSTCKYCAYKEICGR